jgi:hypothetical protein
MMPNSPDRRRDGPLGFAQDRDKPAFNASTMAVGSVPASFTSALSVRCG